LCHPLDGGWWDAAAIVDAGDAGSADDGASGEDVVLEDANPEASVAATDASDASDGSDGFTCDPRKTPSEDGCVVTEALGVFVSAAAGNDASGAGTRASPLASIGKGFDVAKASGKRLYVCAGTYDEHVVVDASRDGVTVYGGLDCTSWAYATANRVVVAPSTTGYALKVESLTAGVTIEDVEFYGRDASPAHAGESSIAAFVHVSENVSLVRVMLVAGTGTAGAPGASAGPPGATNWNTADGGLDGLPATSSVPGGARSCACASSGPAVSAGGRGGSASQTPLAGTPAYSATSDAGAGGAAGDNKSSCNMLGGGSDGISAPAAAAAAAAGDAGADADAGAAASPSLGQFGDAGWTPAIGTDGLTGLPGQGGGGGGDGSEGTGFGGGGACGGCGGAGGSAGSGGGGSIALLVAQSTVALTSSTLTAAAGGGGGNGGAGESGQQGGVGGVQAAGCPGGGGGAGSGGNGGQGGPGGISVGIVFTGPAPTVDGVAISAQTTTLAGVTVAVKAPGGAAGMGGAAAMATGAAAGANGEPGLPGASQPVLGL